MKNVFKEIIENKNLNEEFEEYKGDNSLKNAYYAAADAIYDLQDNLHDGNYKKILKEFDKVVKAFQTFDKKVGFGKNL